jgi:hypothetical protein
MRSEHLFAYTLYEMGICLFAYIAYYYIAYSLYKKPMRSEHLFAYTHIRWASVCIHAISEAHAFRASVCIHALYKKHAVRASVCIHAISEAHLLNDACKNLRRS